MSAGKAVKNDAGKPDLSLVPLVAAVRMAEAFGIGLRYGRYNYCKGMEASRVTAAMMRHVMKWFNGEEFDPDGQHHLGSVLACAAMILRMQELGTLVDDRYVPPALEPAPPAETLFQVIAVGTYDKKPLVIGQFADAAAAERWAHDRLFDWPGFTLSVLEVPDESATTT